MRQRGFLYNAASRLAAQPWTVFGTLVFLFTARWIWIAGITGDYGWAYEPATRILRGEIPYRDYVSSLPPLMPYTLAPFIALFKGNLWAWQIHLYLWWIASLAVGLQLAKRLGAEPKLQTAIVFLAAVLSYPASWTGVPHNYAAVTFFGTAALALLAFRKNLASRFALLTGISVTLATFAKQNIGAAAFFAAIVGLVEACRANQKSALTFKVFASFFLGMGLMFLPFLFYFSYYAGLRETLMQFAIDGGGGKGIAKMLVHTLPVFYFEVGFPNRHVLDVAITVIATGLFLWFFAARIRRRSIRTTEHDSGDRWIMAALAIVVSLAFATLLSLPALKQTLLEASFYFRYTNVIFFFYCAVLTFSFVVLCKAAFTRAFSLNFVVCIWLIILVCSFALSLAVSCIYAAPVAIPLLFGLFKEYGLIKYGLRLSAFCSIVATIFVSFLPQPPNFAPTFERLYPLPANSNFAGLYGSGQFAWKVNQISENISPVIKDHTTLWLVMGGPHLAFGGKPVKAVPLMHEDTYGLRAEAPLMEEWHKTPPEFVVHQKSLPVRAGSQFFNEAYVSKWLAADYDLIWHQADLDLWLWKRKENNM